MDETGSYTDLLTLSCVHSDRNAVNWSEIRWYSSAVAIHFIAFPFISFAQYAPSGSRLRLRWRRRVCAGVGRASEAGLGLTAAAGPGRWWCRQRWPDLQTNAGVQRRLDGLATGSGTHSATAQSHCPHQQQGTTTAYRVGAFWHRERGAIAHSKYLIVGKL